MKLQRAIAGQQAETEIFYNVTLDSPPVYRITDFNGNLVLKGAGAQDIVNTKRWTAQVLIPTNAPIGRPDQLYSIEWTGKVGASKYVQTDSFSVNPIIDVYTQADQERILMAGKNLSDTLVLDDPSPVTNLMVKLYNPISDMPIFESGIIDAIPSRFDGHSQVFNYRSPDPVDTMVAPTYNYKPYLIEWSWTQDGEDQSEFHYLYIVSNKVLLLLHNLRMKIDKAKTKQRNKALEWRDVDLLNYVDQGVQYLNASPPTMTGFSLNTAPAIFDTAIINCSAFAALCAQYLAEGQSTFDFSGQSVTLTIDRTQFIDAEINRLQSYMDSQLRATKKLWVMTSGGSSPGFIRTGALGINVGPSLNYNGGRYGMLPALWARGLLW